LFTPSEFFKEAVEKVKREVKGRAVVAVSGGIDSTVAAKIASDALGDRATAIYVNTGLMRENEEVDVRNTLKGSQ